MLKIWVNLGYKSPNASRVPMLVKFQCKQSTFHISTQLISESTWCNRYCNWLQLIQGVGVDVVNQLHISFDIWFIARCNWYPLYYWILDIILNRYFKSTQDHSAIKGNPVTHFNPCPLSVHNLLHIESPSIKLLCVYSGFVHNHSVSWGNTTFLTSVRRVHQLKNVNLSTALDPCH